MHCRLRRANDVQNIVSFGIDLVHKSPGFCILEKPDKNSRNIKEMKIVDAGVLRTKSGISSCEENGLSA